MRDEAHVVYRGRVLYRVRVSVCSRCGVVSTVSPEFLRPDDPLMGKCEAKESSEKNPKAGDIGQNAESSSSAVVQGLRD
jgi:hypothetical protein